MDERPNLAAGSYGAPDEVFMLMDEDGSPLSQDDNCIPMLFASTLEILAWVFKNGLNPNAITVRVFRTKEDLPLNSYSVVAIPQEAQ